MLLYREHSAGCLCCLYDKLLIKRFDRVDIDHLCIDPVLCQKLRSF